MNAELTPAQGNGADLIWTSSDPSVVSITRSGGNACELCFLRNGNVRITVTARNVPAVTDWLEFRIDLPVPDLEVSLDRETLSLPEGGGMKLTAAIRPEGAHKGGIV